MGEEEDRRRNLAPALARLGDASPAKEVVLDLYSIGGRPVLDAVARAIGGSPLGREYLSSHIHAVERERAALPPWRDRLRLWLTRERRAGHTSMSLHSGCMTTIRFMLVEEGFAKLLNGSVSIEPAFSDAVRLAREAARAFTGEDDA